MARSIKQAILGRPAVAGAVLGLGLAGAAIAGVASAQTPTPPAGQSQAASFIQRLAQHLGVPQDRVTQALTNTRNDMLGEAVTAGRLTQQQADELRNRPIDQGRGLGLEFGGRGHGPAGKHGIGVAHETVAQRLGITPEELRTQLQSGRSIAQIAQARGIDPQTVINQLVADARTKLNEAVTAGRLTQAQADQMAQNLPDRIRQMVERVPTPGEAGPRGGRGPRGQAPSGQTPSGQPPAPSTSPSAGVQ